MFPLRSQLLLFGASILAQEQPHAPRVHPLLLDRTGIRWVVPFDTARAEARERQRLLLIKPIAFGSNREGCW
jgi:hypothetical protein